MAKVLIMMADYGHDPTETAVPYSSFREAGFDVSFATEKGVSPRCDERMLQGITRHLFGTPRSVLKKHAFMIASNEWGNALSWSASEFDLSIYDLVFFPGGQDKSIRQLIDSAVLHKLLLDYFPQTKKPSKKVIGAICHGVKVLSDTKSVNGRSILYGCKTAALPSLFEQFAFQTTRAFIDGDYFKVYGARSEDLEHSVCKELENPSDDLKMSWSPFPFVVEDDNFNYISARCQIDAQKLSEGLVEAVRNVKRS